MRSFLALGLALAWCIPSPAVALSYTPSCDAPECNTLIHGVTPQIGRLHLPLQYWQWMREAGRDFGVDPCLIMATAAIESRFNPRATSGHGACIGLMQLHRDTARSLGVNPWDPRENIRGGARVLARLLGRYNGNLRRVYGRYNATCTGAYYREILRAYRQAKRSKL